ncbi:sugar ABC transporter ATP-binding protein [Clostridium sp. AM58-1XD]|uniref:sugar ABC transporter ATP-binding protein n=1 Tax=Clostridium sp. AM58-1XD TaxID=2292307 RepID=UPI000E4DC432|nr:sugar ABC transporter ATP-binding protein [Clostridium sp. AM58-1XD]RGY97797.1 sugar ABC transporter ATP-binding protein [Clostridium sp. AM58-1XD]
MAEYRLEMRGVSKSFPGVKALDGINLKVRPGTVHALMGENGAGKSTLMKCLFGIYHMDEGEIYLDGKKENVGDPDEALHKGLAMVHQELQPIPERTVGENMYTGRYPVKKFGPLKIIDHKKMFEETEKWLNDVKMPFNPKAKLGTMSIAQMQSVEIAKAVSMQARVVILDEPTSSLTDNEVQALFRIIRDLKGRGVSLIYISHKMAEIREIADDITIMRDGTYVGSWAMNDITDDEIVKQMVGRELTNIYPPKNDAHVGEVLLDVRGFSSIHERSFQDCSFTLRRGEILGFGGLVGAQRTELMEAIFGMRHISKGEVYIEGKKVNIRRPQDAIRGGIGMITEDRRGTGILGCLSIADNVSISSLSQYLELGVKLNKRKIEQLVKENVAKLSIKTPSSRTLIQSLSGGNQQKVLISRWLANNPDILIMDEPTRGIDVGAKYEIYQIMIDLAKQGKGIIMISSEMPELIGMSNRILVMCNGKITGEVSGDEATQERIMSFATQF